MTTLSRPTCAASLQFGCACWRMAAPLRADYLASGSGPSEKPTPIAETRNLIGGGLRKTAEGATRLSHFASPILKTSTPCEAPYVLFLLFNSET